MDMSDPVNLAEDLLERVAQGNLTFTKSEVKKIAAMLDKLAWRAGDACLTGGCTATQEN